MKTSKSFKFSSSLEEADYDSEMKTLTVKFQGKATVRYIYCDVPASVASRFFTVKSAGRYLARHIKPMFECVKLDSDGDTINFSFLGKGSF